MPGIIVDIAKINIFGELHVVLQCLMLIFQPLAHGKTTERHEPQQCSECRFHVVVPQPTQIRPNKFPPPGTGQKSWHRA